MATPENKIFDVTWESFWQQGIGKGDQFDTGTALPELVTQLPNLPRGARALVPGCGRGYDVELLSKSGRYDTVIGLDLSETAVAAANAYLAECGLDGDASVVQGNFFESDQFLLPFDLVYDYSFLCALPLELRALWAKRMRELIKVGGRLVTVMYPMGKPKEDGGPPYGVSVEDYKELLEGEGGFVARDGPRRLKDEQSHDFRGGGRTYWCVWERV